MGAEWFVNAGGRIEGPLTSGQLKKLAVEQRISTRTRVRKGDEGRWVQASQVRGLFDDPGRDASQLTDAQISAPEAPAASAAANSELKTLLPDRRIWPRILVFELLVALACWNHRLAQEGILLRLHGAAS